MKGLEQLVQLKSSAASNQQDNREKLTLNVSAYNYLWDKLQVVLLVKYFKAEDEAYWILLKEVKPPADEKRQAFTVYIPRESRLTTINWDEDIVNYVRDITHQKITAARPKKNI